MKGLIFILLPLVIFILLCRSNGYAQYRNDHQPYELLKCQGDTFTAISLLWISHKIKSYHDENCTPSITYNEPNLESLIISGGHKVEDGYLKEENINGQNVAYILNLKFVATEDATIRIEHVQHLEHTDITNNCHALIPPVETMTETFTIILKVLTKDVPSLKATKTVLRENRDSVSLSISGCNPLYWGVQFYNPNVCSNDSPPNNLSPSAISLEHVGNPFMLQNSIVFYARCSDNNCVSEWSSPLKIDVIPYSPSLACDDPDLDKVNQISETNRPDFHHYRVETAICAVSEENNWCTRENVMKKLMTQKIYSTPIASDFVPFTGFFGKASVLGASLMTPVDYGPVEHCGLVMLPSGLAMLATAAAFGAVINNPVFTGFYLAMKDHSNQLIGNPIGQYRSGSYSITNYTKTGHILHPGKVVRTVVEDCNSVKIVTVGFGNTLIGDKWNPILGVPLKGVNELFGYILFKNIDLRFKQDFNASIK